MGGASSMWYKKNHRKVLILSYDDSYSNKINQLIFNKDFQLNKITGFANEEMKYKNLKLKLWFLSSNSRHHWRHHYYGSQGVVLIFSITDRKSADKIIIEALTVISDTNLNNIPILIIFDKDNSENNQEFTELFRNKVNKLENMLINTQYIYFDKHIDDLYFGIDWLCENMKPI